METIKIKISVDRELAIGAGCSVFGDSEFELTDEFLSKLSEQERLILAKYLKKDGLLLDGFYLKSLAIPSKASTEQIREALVSRLNELEADQRNDNAKRLAARAEVRQRILATPKNGLVQKESWGSAPWGLIHDLDHYDSSDDPEIAALKKEAEAMRHRLNEEVRLFREADEERQRKADEAQLQRRAEIVEEIRNFAIENVESLQEAARENYEVTSDVLDHIAEKMAKTGAMPAPEMHEILTEGTTEYAEAEWEERNAPRSEAFRLLNHVVDAMQSLKRPACVRVSVSRIMRYSNDATDNHKRTAVIASITVPDTNIRGRHVVFFTE